MTASSSPPPASPRNPPTAARQQQRVDRSAHWDLPVGDTPGAAHGPLLKRERSVHGDRHDLFSRRCTRCDSRSTSCWSANRDRRRLCSRAIYLRPNSIRQGRNHLQGSAPTFSVVRCTWERLHGRGQAGSTKDLHRLIQSCDTLGSPSCPKMFPSYARNA